MNAKLVVVGGKAPAGEYSLQLPTVIGRSRSADVPIGHPLISRQHCELYEADGQLMVRDLGSLNGTFVGETRITEEAVLAPGDLLTVGAVTFQAVYGLGRATDVEEEPDFTLTDSANGEAVQDTAEIAGDTDAPAAAHAAPGGDDGFDMNWLDEGSEEEAPAAVEKTTMAPNPAELAAAEDAAEESDELSDLETVDAKAAKPAAAKPAAAKPAAPKPAAPKPAAAKPAAPVVPADDTTEFAPREPAEENKDVDEDLDDFFRNLK